MYRVGIGYDIHRLVKKRKLILAGIEISYAKGLLGHSDADVVLHSLIDAILGAMAEGDIGEHFSDTDPRLKNISSKELVKRTLKIVKNKKYRIENIDINIILEEPKLKNFKLKMRQNLADCLNLAINCISVKAKTNEGLGEIGRKQAIAAQVVVLLRK